jgi:hypothetical protein
MLLGISMLLILPTSAAFAACTPPSTAGVVICSPANGSTVGSPITISAAATGAGHSITSMKAYLDNVQAAASTTGTLSGSATAAAGTHKLIVNAWESTGTLHTTSVTFTVGSAPPPPPPSGCSTPSTAGVVICTPANGATVSSPVSITAAAAGAGHSITAMRGYLDNTQVAASSSGSLSASVAAAAGTHTLVVNAWESTGTLHTTSVSFTVGGAPPPPPPPGNCSVPSAAGVSICAPSNGSTVNSPFNLAAAANGSGKTITAMRGYLDGGLVASSSSNTMSASLSATTGSHKLIVNAWNSAGTLFTSSSTFTVGTSVPVTPGDVSVLTYHNDLSRTGANLHETTLTPTNVNVTQFGKKFSFAVDGQIYAQPLYVPGLTINGAVRNVVYVATEGDTVYAFDADGQITAPLWSRHLGTPWPDPNEVEGVAPQLGVTSTPVIDTSTNTIYVASITSESGVRTNRLHALDLITGAEKFGGPVKITATVSGTGDDSVAGKISLESNCYQRSGLVLANGFVYVAYGRCKHGWIIAYNKGNLTQASVFNSTPDGAGGAFWNSGGAPAVDSAGNIFALSAVDFGDPDSGFNDSFLKLSPLLALEDYFKPANEAVLRTNDADLGSGSIVLLPDNTSAHPHEMIAAGKDGRIFLVDRDNLGQFGTTDHVVQIVQSGNTQFNNFFDSPAFWNGTIYYHANSDVLQAFSWSNGLLSAAPIASGNTAVFKGHGATPSVSANGNSDGIVWEIEASSEKTGGPAILHAYDANAIGTELYNSNMNATRDGAGPAVKFSVPTIANGRVYVGTGNQLDVYGLF